MGISTTVMLAGLVAVVTATWGVNGVGLAANPTDGTAPMPRVAATQTPVLPHPLLPQRRQAVQATISTEMLAELVAAVTATWDVTGVGLAANPMDGTAPMPRAAAIQITGESQSNRTTPVEVNLQQVSDAS